MISKQKCYKHRLVRPATKRQEAQLFDESLKLGRWEALDLVVDPGHVAGGASVDAGSSTVTPAATVREQSDHSLTASGIKQLEARSVRESPRTVIVAISRGEISNTYESRITFMNF